MTSEPEHSGRYDYLLDPSDLYIVWDRVSGLPAMGTGGILAFATVEEAAAAIRRLDHRLSPGAVSQDPFPVLQEHSTGYPAKGGAADAGEG